MNIDDIIKAFHAGIISELEARRALRLFFGDNDVLDDDRELTAA